MKLIRVLTIVCLCLVATASCSSIEDRLYQVETQLERVRKDNVFLKTEIGDLKYEDGINKQRIGQLVQENKSFRVELDDVKKVRQVDREEIKKLTSQVETLREELEGAVSDVDELKKKIQELESCSCGSAISPITTTSIDASSTSSASTSEMTTWPINAETEFIDVGFSQGKIAVFKELNMIAVGNDVNKFYDLQTRRLMRTFTSGIPTVFKQNQIVTPARNGPVSIWNIETGELITNLKGDYAGWISSTSFNKNKSMLLTGGTDYIVRLWDMIELKQVRTFTGHKGDASSVIFDEARNQVISGCFDGTIRVWNMNDGSIVKVITGHASRVRKLLLDEETGRLLSASFDRTIKEWNMESGTMLRTFEGHGDQINDMIFSEDGQRLISSSNDKSIIIWDKKSGQKINRLNHTDGVVYLALSSLNGQLLSTTVTTKLIFWPVKP